MEGWLGEQGDPLTAEDVAAHLADITSTERYIVPTSVSDEMVDLVRILGIS